MKYEKAVKYYKLAKTLAAEFSKDPSTKVAVIYLDSKTHAVLSLGYNGFPRGVDETIMDRWERPIKYMYCEHAERNGIYNACLNGTSLKDSIAVITMFPCCDCARGIIQSGVKKIITVKPDIQLSYWKESFDISMDMFKDIKMEIMFIEEKDL